MPWCKRVVSSSLLAFKMNMRTYKFANIAARAYPTLRDLDNRWVFPPDTVVVVSVSSKYKAEVVEAIKLRGIEHYHFPLNEETSDIGWSNVTKAVEVLLRYAATGRHMLVHCDCGNHRSRMVVEAFHYTLYGTHFADEYKGYPNHLVYDCQLGHLPPLKQVERQLRALKK